MKLEDLTDEQLAEEVKRRKIAQLPTAVGIWHVTTANDCEGRTTKDLGVHTGHISDIALELSGNANPVLNFRQLKQLPAKVAQRDEVHVVIACVSDLGVVDKYAHFMGVLTKDDVIVSDKSCYYGAILLKRKK